MGDERRIEWHRGHDRPTSIDARQARQQEEIRRGIASGELTPREAERLWAEQQRIERHEQRFRADGVFTSRERMHLQRELDRSAWHIRHELHDWQRSDIGMTRFGLRDRGRN